MSVRCHAHRSDGEPCERYAIEGATVCPAHGGNAPQVRAAAALRVLELVDPALAQLRRLLNTEPDTPQEWGQVLRAVQIVLDKAGLVSADDERPITRERLEAEIARMEAEIELDHGVHPWMAPSEPERR